MTAVWVLVAAAGGLFAGSVIWTLARNQAGERHLFAAPIGDDSNATPRPRSAWLPLLGFGTAREGGVSRWRVPFECLVAIYAGSVVALADDGWSIARGLIFAVPLLMILLVDWWTRWIYIPVLLTGAVLGFALSLETGWDGLLRALAGFGLGGLIFGVFYVLGQVLYRGARATPFGRGDVMLAMMIGAMVGIGDVVATLFMGMIIAAVVLGVLLATKRLTRRSVAAYGPFLCLGALLSLLTM